MEKVSNLNSELSLLNVRESAEKLSNSICSVVRSRSSKIGAFSSDIAQRFQNDLYAWSTSPTVYALKKELQPLTRAKGAGKQDEFAENSVSNANFQPVVVYAENLNVKQNKLLKKKIEEDVDKLIRVILPESEEPQNYEKKMFRHMRHYSFYRRTDRDLIRRRLASDTTDLYDLARPLAAGGGATCSTNNTTSGDSCSLGSSVGGGGSLHPRLRAGQNLQICFMNETVSDCEEESGDGPVTGDCDATQSAPQSSGAAGQVASQLSTIAAQPHAAAAATAATPSAVQQVALPVTAADFAGYHLQLRNHVQLQLAEGQLAVEQQLRQLATEQSSPTAQVVRTALDKIGADVSKTRRRVNRSLLSELNVAQLQIFANDFHTRIEELNSVLVAGLMERDESLMERDSRLVHIDDLNSYYDQKQQQQQLQQRKQSPLVECRPMASDRAVITPLTPSRSKSLLHSLVQKVVK